MNNYVLVGVGGTGSHLLKPLHVYLTAHHKNSDWVLWLIDGDVVEEKNLDRQSFRPGAITMNKAEAAALMLGDKEHVKVKPEYLSEENIESLIRERDTVFIAADNFTVRKRIEERALRLADITVINGGNEKYDGTVQLWVREKDRNVTPRIGYLHPEVAIQTGEDRAEMTCVQAAALPGGEQTIIANIHSAMWMLTALWRRHEGLYAKMLTGPTAATWTELYFNPIAGEVVHIDQRLSDHWNDA